MSAPIAFLLVAKYSLSGFPGMGAHTVGSLVMSCCSWRNACWYLESQRKSFPFFSGDAKAAVRVVRPRINHQMYKSLLRKLLSCMSVAGGFIVVMACTLLGSTSIPLWCTRNPKNFPTVTPKAHLNGFMRSLSSRHLSKPFVRQKDDLLWFFTSQQCHPHSPRSLCASCHERLRSWPFL